MSSLKELKKLTRNINSYVTVIEQNLENNKTFNWYTGWADHRSLVVLDWLLRTAGLSVRVSDSKDFEWIISK